MSALKPAPEATRMAITDAAEELFRQRGYSKTTIVDISSRVNMSPAKIYRHFKSKLEIVGVICNRTMEEADMSTLKPTAPEATRIAITNTAEELFRRMGYSKTTMVDISSRVNMSPANIYRYFKSKQEIAGVICSQIIEKLVERCRTSINRSASAEQRLATVLLTYHHEARRVSLENRGIFDLFVDGLGHLWPEFRWLHQAMTTLVAQVIRDGVSQGEFKVEDPELVASLVLRAVIAYVDPRHIARLLNDSAILGEQEHLEADLLAIVAVLSRGIRP
jgi:AcrR family transcriptional regulator